MRIAMVAPVPPPYGGIGNWVLMLDEYVKNRDDVSFVHINTSPVSRGLDGRSLWERVVTQGFIMLKKRGELKKLLRSEHVDIVHITTSGQLAAVRDIMMLKVARHAHVRSIYHIRFGRVPEIAAANTHEWELLKRALSLADQVIAIDTKTEKAVRKYAPDVKVCYTPNPFDTGKVKAIPTHDEKCTKEIVFIGWVVKTKGVGELLEAWSGLRSAHPDWTLRIVGPYAKEYRDELNGKFTGDQTVFDGEKPHDEAMEILARADIFILPSYTEGFPNVVLEAMALKKPIIATALGAIPDILEGCGVVIPPKDTQAVRVALEEMMNDEACRSELGQKAGEVLKSRYTLETVFEQYKAIWSGASGKAY